MTARQSIALRMAAEGSGALAARVLATLPAWFGIESATAHYVEVAERSPTVIASDDGEDVGFLTLVTHSPYSAEIHVIAVLPGHHRHGVGRAMLERAEAHLRTQGIEYLQVKTLSAAHPDPGYARTRAFYAGVGFRLLEEFPDLWGRDNPAAQLVKGL